jgi:hypothetical protein
MLSKHILAGQSARGRLMLLTLLLFSFGCSKPSPSETGLAQDAAAADGSVQEDTTVNGGGSGNSDPLPDTTADQDIFGDAEDADALPQDTAPDTSSASQAANRLRALCDTLVETSCRLAFNCSNQRIRDQLASNFGIVNEASCVELGGGLRDGCLYDLEDVASGYRVVSEPEAAACETAAATIDCADFEAGGALAGALQQCSRVTLAGALPTGSPCRDTADCQSQEDACRSSDSVGVATCAPSAGLACGSELFPCARGEYCLRPSDTASSQPATCSPLLAAGAVCTQPEACLPPLVCSPRPNPANPDGSTCVAPG